MQKENDNKDGYISETDENPLEALVNKENGGKFATKSQQTEKQTKNSRDSRFGRFKSWYAAHKKLSIPASVLLFILLIAAIPFTRYAAAGTVYKKDFSLQLKDSTAGTPVSGAQITIGPASAITDGSGKAVLKQVNVGNHTATVIKKHYKDTRLSVLVPILSQKNMPSFTVVATGRQVKVVLADTISQKALSGVEITAGDVEAKTDKNGSAVIVLPVGTTSQKATMSLQGYNETEVTLAVSEKEIKENKFKLTPSGKLYFLSKKNGKIDLVKTDLDGTNRKTVLAGTGKEEDRGTVLLASRDWKYLALLSRRDSAQAKLYLIETENDKLVTFDEGNARFTLVGWNDHNFVYQVDRLALKDWQAKKYAIKSFNAEKQQLITLDESKAEGSSANDAAFESINNVYSVDKVVVYTKGWTSYDYYNPNKYSGKDDGVYQMNADGTGKKTIMTFGHATGNSLYFQSYLYKPQEIYYSVQDGGESAKYYEYENGKLSGKSDLKDEFNKYFDEGGTTYLLSPSGKETFWKENRDGKSALFAGNPDGDSSKDIAALSDEYQTYGWYSDNYLLVSKKSSEIYILPKAGVKAESEMLKITDYHKPTQNFFGYGGGYGGI